MLSILRRSVDPRGRAHADGLHVLQHAEFSGPCDATITYTGWLHAVGVYARRGLPRVRVHCDVAAGHPSHANMNIRARGRTRVALHVSGRARACRNFGGGGWRVCDCDADA